MAAKRSTPEDHVQYHKDGTVWAKGKMLNGVLTGYWEWYRKDGTRLRSGHFENGEQVGEWTTYDRSGQPYKVTTIKPKAKAKPKATPTSIDDYLLGLPDDKRSALEKLRKIILAVAPRAEECICYRLPAFRLDGKPLVYIGAAAGHCAFYPGSASAVAAHQDELTDYVTSKGAIRFQPDKPLPVKLVRKITKYRIAENAGKI